MAAAAIHQICTLHGMPFLTIKDISNNELWASSDLQGDDRALPPPEVARRSAALMRRVLDALPR